MGTVRADKRPALLVAALFVVLCIIVITPPLARYFTFVVPNLRGFGIVMGLTAMWFLALRFSWRSRLSERFLGLQRTP